MGRKRDELLEYVTTLTRLRAEDIPIDGVIRAGVRADAILKLPGRSKKFAVLPPSRREDGTVRWYYRDFTVVLHYSQGHWRVRELEEAVKPKPTPKKERARKRRLRRR